MKYYISDLHFFDKKMITFMDKRPFHTVIDMNAYMISQWNKRITTDDQVYILGDFSNGTAEQTEMVLTQLKGNKYLIIGNHDEFIQDSSFLQSLFKWVGPYLEVSDNNRNVVLSHYPICCYNHQYHRDINGIPKTFMLYGHVHNTFDEYLINEYKKIAACYERNLYNQGYYSIPTQMINCFCVFSKYQPLSLDEWIRVDKKRHQNDNFMNNRRY